MTAPPKPSHPFIPAHLDDYGLNPTQFRILCRIAPNAFEQNDGLFVALDDDDMIHWDAFVKNCAEAGIPIEELGPDRARDLEPNLAADLKGAVRVGDAAMDPWRLAMHFFATARANGADIRSFSEPRNGGPCLFPDSNYSFPSQVVSPGVVIEI